MCNNAVWRVYFRVVLRENKRWCLELKSLKYYSNLWLVWNNGEISMCGEGSYTKDLCKEQMQKSALIEEGHRLPCHLQNVYVFRIVF